MKVSLRAIAPRHCKRKNLSNNWRCSRSRTQAVNVFDPSLVILTYQTGHNIVAGKTVHNVILPRSAICERVSCVQESRAVSFTFFTPQVLFDAFSHWPPILFFVVSVTPSVHLISPAASTVLSAACIFCSSVFVFVHSYAHTWATTSLLSC